MMKRTLLLLAGAVLLCALPLRAQDGSRFLQSLAERLHRTPKAYDTSYVRKLDLPWTASVSTDLIRTGLDITSTVTEESASTPYLALSDHLHRSFFAKAGASLAYGPVQVGAMVGLDPKGTPRGRYNRFALSQPYFGLDFHYYSIRDHLQTTVYKYPDAEEAVAAYRSEHGLPDGAEVSPEAVAGYRKEHAWAWRPAYLYGRTSLTLSARTGISYSWDRFFVCATVDFNRFAFRGFESDVTQGGTTWHTAASGSFYDLTSSIRLNVRF